MHKNECSIALVCKRGARLKRHFSAPCDVYCKQSIDAKMLILGACVFGHASVTRLFFKCRTSYFRKELWATEASDASEGPWCRKQCAVRVGGFVATQHWQRPLDNKLRRDAALCLTEWDDRIEQREGKGLLDPS